MFAARKLLSCVIFDQAELKMLDDVMPETTQFKKDDNSIADQVKICIYIYIFNYLYRMLQFFIVFSPSLLDTIETFLYDF